MNRTAIVAAVLFGVAISLLLLTVQLTRLLWWPPRALDGHAAAIGALFLLVGLALGVRLRWRADIHRSRHTAPKLVDGPLSLTRREHEVLLQLAEGCSNNEIAERHFVSESTIKTQVRQICAKLDAKSRLHAVARARELGLL